MNFRSSETAIRVTRSLRWPKLDQSVRTTMTVIWPCFASVSVLGSLTSPSRASPSLGTSLCSAQPLHVLPPVLAEEPTAPLAVPMPVVQNHVLSRMIATPQPRASLTRVCHLLSVSTLDNRTEALSCRPASRHPGLREALRRNAMRSNTFPPLARPSLLASDSRTSDTLGARGSESRTPVRAEAYHRSVL